MQTSLKGSLDNCSRTFKSILSQYDKITKLALEEKYNYEQYLLQISNNEVEEKDRTKEQDVQLKETNKKSNEHEIFNDTLEEKIKSITDNLNKLGNESEALRTSIQQTMEEAVRPKLVENKSKAKELAPDLNKNNRKLSGSKNRNGDLENKINPTSDNFKNTRVDFERESDALRASTLRTMGELVHPETDYVHHLNELRKFSAPSDAAKYLIDKGFFSSALIGILANYKNRNERLTKFCQNNERILYAPSNIDTIGRNLGIGFQPQVNYNGLAEALVANSESLTPRNLQELRQKVNDEINCGAWLFSPFMPRRSSKGQGTAGHVDAFLIPDNGGPRWALTSLINPTLSHSEIVINRLKKAGFCSFKHTPPQTLLEKLNANEPPNPLVGNWNNIIATSVEDKEGRNLTFARLASAQAGKEDEIFYQTMIISKIRLSVESYRTACLIYELQELSKKQNGGHLLSIGTHTGINSCGQLTGALFDQNRRLSCENLMDIYNRAIEASTEVWIAREGGPKLEPFNFILDNNTDGFIPVKKANARTIFNHYLTAPTLTNSRPGRSSYLENYGTYTIPHPNPKARDFYNDAADIALTLLENNDSK